MIYIFAIKKGETLTPTLLRFKPELVIRNSSSLTASFQTRLENFNVNILKGDFH